MKKQDKKQKPKVAIVGLTCCEGCEFAILDLHESGDFVTKKDPLKTLIWNDSFIDFNLLSNQGLPVSKKGETYQKRKNIWFSAPRENNVAQFKILSSDKVSLDFYIYPSISDSGLGALPIARNIKLEENYEK